MPAPESYKQNRNNRRKGAGMFQISDTDTGLSLSLGVDPKPRNPRLVEDNVFQVVTWVPGLGDPHAWDYPEAFLAVIKPDAAAIFPLRSIETKRGTVLVHAQPGEGPVVGYAFATFERLCIEFGLDEITDDIRDETLEEAENVCLGELQAYDEFVSGDVYRYEIMDGRGGSLEKRRDLYGEEYARHIAQEAFDRHLTTVHMDG